MNNFKIIELYGKKCKVYQVNCILCENKFFARNVDIKRGRKYCSQKCSYEHSKRRKILTCDLCKTKFERVLSKIRSKSDFNFCSRSCKDKAQSLPEFSAIHSPHYNQGGIKYRRKAFILKDKKCEKCNYSKIDKMLDVHHVDGNRENNDITNLEILCVWCHAFITRQIDPHNWDGEI